MNKKLLMALSILIIGMSSAALKARWGHHGGFGFGIGFGYPSYWGGYGYPYWGGYYPRRTVIVERPVVEKQIYVTPSTSTYVDESVPMTSTKSDNYWIIHNLTNKDITVMSEKTTVPMGKNEESKKIYHGGSTTLTVSIGGKKTKLTNINGRVLTIFLDNNGAVKVETKS